MRILIISYRFPPYNSIGAVRVGKTAKYLTSLGHEVKVVTAGDQPLRSDLALEIDSSSVVYTDWVNVNWPAELLSGGRKRVQQRGFGRANRGALAAAGGSIYKDLLNIPDGQVGWLPFAVRGARKVLQEWRADLIYASAAPFTALFVASRMSAEFGIPWVAEFRDLWVDGGYESTRGWRARIDRWLEKRAVATASGFVTVSPPLAEILERKFSRLTRVILNGYDPDDLPAPRPPTREGPLRIVYTGIVSEGKRDPSPLFRAIRELDVDHTRLRVSFYGRYVDFVLRLAREHGVERHVDVHEPVSYRESLRIQHEADVLLLLLWNDPKERGVFTGKLFEYLAARRPILVLGPADNVAAELVEERGAGIVSLDHHEVANQLRRWMDQREREGGIPHLPPSLASGFSREEQVVKLNEFLEQIVRGEGGAPAAPRVSR